jgi:hypothetical protein
MSTQEQAAPNPKHNVLMRDEEWPLLTHGIHSICIASDMALDAAKSMAVAFDAQGRPWTDEQHQKWETMTLLADRLTSTARFVVEKIDYAYHKMKPIDDVHGDTPTPEQPLPLSTRLSAAAGLLAGHNHRDSAAAVLEAINLINEHVISHE